MSSLLKLRRGSTVAHETFTGADGEVTFNTDTNQLVSHDGATAGGFPHVKSADLAASSGAGMVGYMPVGIGAVATTVQAKLRERVSVLDFGASASASAEANLAAFKLAVAATSTGGVLSIPASSSFYSIDTSGGLTSAIEINKSMTVVFEGDVKASFGAIQANPPTIFYVTAANVSFIGNGKLIGDGTVNSVNTGTDATMPSLVRVTGNSFTFDGPLIDTPHKIGIHLDSCYYAKVTNSNFTGGPIAYSDTAYFGIRATGGGKHIISNNQFYPSGTGGMFVQCVFFSATSDCLIDGNVATKPYEKIVYLNGNRNIVIGNTVIGNSGTIPGTNQQGTVGISIRCDGANNKITNNYTTYGGGVGCRIGGGNEISGNTLLNAGSSAIVVFDATSILDYTTIRNNVITCGNLAGVVVLNGILVSSLTGSNKYIDISGNTVSGFGIANPLINVVAWQATTTYPTVSLVKPTVGNSRYYTATGGGISGGSQPTWPTTPGATVVDGTITWTCQAYDTANASISLAGSFAYDYCTITDNILIDGFYGVQTINLNNSRVSYNTVRSVDYWAKETSGVSNKYERNQTTAANSGVTGIADTSIVFDFEYVEGSWTPNQGAGLTVDGAFSSTGRYTKIGRMVHVTGTLSGSTSIAIAAAGFMFTNLPFTLGAPSVGSISTSSLTSPGTATAISGASVYGSVVSPAVSTIYFSLTYSV